MLFWITPQLIISDLCNISIDTTVDVADRLTVNKCDVVPDDRKESPGADKGGKKVEENPGPGQLDGRDEQVFQDPAETHVNKSVLSFSTKEPQVKLKYCLSPCKTTPRHKLLLTTYTEQSLSCVR